MKDQNRKFFPGLPKQLMHCQSSRPYEKTSSVVIFFMPKSQNLMFVVWEDTNIALSTKTRLMSSLVISVFLYARETWTLTAESERKIQATEMRCLRKLLGIFNGDCVTNEEVRSSIRHAIGPYKYRIAIVRKRKLRWYRHITKST